MNATTPTMSATTFAEFVDRHNADHRHHHIQMLRYKLAVRTYYPMPPMKGLELDTNC